MSLILAGWAVLACASNDLCGSEEAASLLNPVYASEIRRDERSGAVRFLRVDLLAGLGGSPRERNDFCRRLDVEVALAFLVRNKDIFLLEDPRVELRHLSTSEDDLGYRQVRFAQEFHAIPVINGFIVVHFTASNEVYLVTGSYIPTPSRIAVEPSITGDHALDSLKETRLDDAVIEAGRLVIYQDNRVSPVLAFEFEVHEVPAVSEFVYVDATTGTVVAQRDLVNPGDIGRRQ